jgi:hypothetical protein
MLKKLATWYKNQQPLKQLGLMLLFNFLFWIVLSYIGDLVFPDIDNETVKHRVFHAIWMAFWWTVFFNWKLVKLFFFKKAKSTASN